MNDPVKHFALPTGADQLGQRLAQRAHGRPTDPVRQFPLHDRAFLGGGAVIHQFSRIGEGAMVGGGARISLDVPPFTTATERNAMIGLNEVGLRRRGLVRATLVCCS